MPHFAAPIAVPMVALIALVLTGCARPAAEPTSAPTTAHTPTPHPSAIVESTGTAEPDAIDTSGWHEFATDDGSVAFRYPSDWTLESASEFFAPDAGRDDVQDPYERWMDSATLTAPNGQQLLAMYDVVDIGGACGEGSLRTLEVLASEPAQPVGTLDSEGESVIATVALGTVDDRWRVGIGITDEVSLEAEQTCLVYFVSGSSDGGVGFGTHFRMGSTGEDVLWTVDSLDDARAYMETEEYRTIVEILRSFETT